MTTEQHNGQQWLSNSAFHHLYQWCLNLHEPGEGGGKRVSDGRWRADSAILRRAQDVEGVMLTEPYQRLYQELDKLEVRQGRWSDSQLERLAVTVALLAHVQNPVAHDKGQALPKAMSGKREGGGKDATNLVSPLRFRRILEVRDMDELLTTLRRTLPLVGKTPIDAQELAKDLYCWGSKTVRKWAFAYEWPDPKKTT